MSWMFLFLHEWPSLYRGHSSQSLLVEILPIPAADHLQEASWLFTRSSGAQASALPPHLGSLSWALTMYFLSTVTWAALDCRTLQFRGCIFWLAWPGLLSHS
jgi:hypothetical protein